MQIVGILICFLPCEKCINISLFCLATSYKLTVTTGNVRGAGTDANVYLQMFGNQGDTGRLPLRQSENNKNKFEKARADIFTVEAVDIGQVSVREKCLLLNQIESYC